MAFTVGSGAVVSLAVALRFAARWRSQAIFAADDWWIIASLIPFYSMIGSSIAGTVRSAKHLSHDLILYPATSVGGLGRSVSELSPRQITSLLKVCSKLSHRTFETTPSIGVSDSLEMHGRPFSRQIEKD